MTEGRYTEEESNDPVGDLLREALTNLATVGRTGAVDLALERDALVLGALGRPTAQWELAKVLAQLTVEFFVQAEGKLLSDACLIKALNAIDEPLERAVERGY